MEKNQVLLLISYFQKNDFKNKQKTITSCYFFYDQVEERRQNENEHLFALIGQILKFSGNKLNLIAEKI